MSEQTGQNIDAQEGALVHMPPPPVPAPLGIAGLNIEALLEKALTAEAAVDVIERFMVMRREMKTEAAVEAYNSAMAAFQAECPVIKKDTQVHERNSNRVRYSYAQLDSIVHQVKPLLQRHGFSHREDAIVEEQTIERRSEDGKVFQVQGGFVTAVCRVIHSAGHSEESRFKIPIDPDGYMNQAQKFASAMTFAKRYAFCNAFGILTGDQDDDSGGSEDDPGPGRGAPTRQTVAPAKQNVAPAKQTGVSEQQKGVSSQQTGKPAAPVEKALAHPAKYPTAATRDWALKEIIEQGPSEEWSQRAAFLHEFLIKSGCLMPNQGQREWPLAYVPASKAQVEQIIKALNDFAAGNPATFPFHNGVNPADNEPKPKAATMTKHEDKEKAIEVPREGVDPSAPDAPWQQLRVPYGKHAGIELGKLDSKVLWGFWKYTKVDLEYQGRPRPANKIASDQAFRAALDEAGKHHEFRD